MALEKLTRSDLIFRDVEADDIKDLLRFIATRMGERGVVDDPEHLYRRLWEREQLGSTGVGSGVAIPHCKMSGVAGVVLAVATVPEGIDFGAVDGQPVHLVFVIVSPSKSTTEHLQSLAEVSKWVKSDRRVERVLRLETSEELYELLAEEG